MSKRRVGAATVISGSIAFIVVAMLIGSWSLLHAAAEIIPGIPLGPTPTPVASSVLSESSPPSDEGDPSFTPPGANPPWLVSGPPFANTVLHWTSTGYRMSLNDEGSANAETLIGEYWVEVGADGAILRYREYFMRADGVFYQETAFADGKAATVWGQGTYPPQPARSCVVIGPSSPPSGSRPEYAADPASLATLDFASSNAAVETLPVTSPLSDVTPLEIHESNAPIQGWERREKLDNGMAVTRNLVHDASGRVVLAGMKVTSASGVVLREMRVKIGALEVYDPTSVPDSVFALILSDQEPCHG